MKVKKAVILAAGMGTRMLPSSKVIPKEILPVVDTPAIQVVVEEAVASGIEEIVLVISNRAEAPGIAHAARAGIAHRTIADPDRQAFATEANAALRQSGAELVALAGFMRILDTAFVDAWHDRLVNIHPSLLPAFPGLHPQRQALAAGVRFSGCTVHFVRAQVDTGPIIAQAVVPVRADDDEAGLSARILAAEHRLYPMAVRLFAEGRLRTLGDRVAISGAAVIV